MIKTHILECNTPDITKTASHRVTTSYTEIMARLGVFVLAATAAMLGTAEGFRFRFCMF